MTRLVLDSCASTNDEARRIADEGAEAFSHVIAGTQTAGRGRAGHGWSSPPGAGLYLSVVLRPDLPLEKLPLCTIAVGVAVAETVAEACGSAGLKWPNDVLVNGRKICGVLCESAGAGADGRQCVIAGIGLNVNAKPSDLPPRVIFPATSLAIETGRTFSNRSLAGGILARLRARIAELEGADGAARIVAAASRLDALRGRRIAVDGENAGTDEGVAPSGALLARGDDGALREIHAGSVSLAEDSAAGKAEWRRFARALRRIHADDPKPNFTGAVTRRPEWGRAETVMLYLPFGVEPDVRPLIGAAFADGKRVCVPAFVPEAECAECTFPEPGAFAPCELGPEDETAPGYLGIEEPVEKKWVRPEKIDLWIVPGLMFDSRGTRLGHGKGHIDRLLAPRREDAPVFGLAFPWQITAADLPAEFHDARMDAVITPLEPILLHSCCGPCSTHCVRELRGRGFEPTLCFSNSNIDTREEYDRRLSTLREFATRVGARVLADPYDPESWNAAVRGLEGEKEGGARCAACFRHNLARAAEKAEKEGFRAFTTSLTVSPHKKSAMVFAAGREAAAGRAAAFEDFDFKKDDGFLDSVRLTEKYGLYRQNYCGCKYSKVGSKK